MPQIRSQKKYRITIAAVTFVSDFSGVTAPTYGWSVTRKRKLLWRLLDSGSTQSLQASVAAAERCVRGYL